MTVRLNVKIYMCTLNAIIFKKHVLLINGCFHQLIINKKINRWYEYLMMYNIQKCVPLLLKRFFVGFSVKKCSIVAQIGKGVETGYNVSLAS